MRPRTSGFVTGLFTCAIAALLALGGCSTTNKSSPAAVADPTATAVQPRNAMTTTRPAGEPGIGQEKFDSDQEAVAALIAACKSHDHAALDKLFGPSVTEFMSGDKVEDEKSFDRFVERANELVKLEQKDDNTSFIDIGKDAYPFPIPLTRLANGKWFFDTEAGKKEILARRIGGNELEAIKVCRAYVEAQREYASEDRDGSGVMKYAQHIISTSGKDGLYWTAGPDEEQSPFGPIIAQATEEGYMPGDTAHKPQPYHGYIFKILTSQGPDAPGGRYSYVINGNMIAGFALVAAPVEYGNSGVYTFIISHSGILYQKDLGPNTTILVRGMKEYNPDKTWDKVAD